MYTTSYYHDFHSVYIHVHVGRYDLADVYVTCDACNTIFDDQLSDVVTKGYWPGSVSKRSQYLFDQDLFRFFDLLQKNNPGLSQSGFLRTLEQFSSARGRVN